MTAFSIRCREHRQTCSRARPTARHVGRASAMFSPARGGTRGTEGVIMGKKSGFLVFQATTKMWAEFTALLEDYPHVTWRFFRDVPYWWVEVGGRLTPKEKRRIARRLYLIATRTGARCLPVHSALNEAFWNLGEVSADSAADLL